MEIEIPEKAEKIIEILEAAGFEAYAVGGCVRDALLGRTPEDWDITTSATPEEVKALFHRTVDTGLAHGTVTVLLGKEKFEVTTYRIDGKYLDGRHPETVSFTKNLTEDLKRRDFTINAMAYHPKKGLVDLFSGRSDLQNRQIRCVGNPAERFTEDALRILRAVRFAAQLDFSVEEETKEAVAALAGDLSKISRERIQVELTKLLLSDHPGQMKTLSDLGILPVILPELCGMDGDFAVNDAALQASRADRFVRYAIFFSGCGKETGKMLRSLKLDNETIGAVQILTDNLFHKADGKEETVREMLSGIGAELFFDLLDVQEAFLTAKEKETGASFQVRQDLSLERRMAEKILSRGDCLSLKDLAVSGKDLAAEGVKPGPEMGRMLNGLLAEVLKDPEKNTKEELLFLVRTKINTEE